MDMILEIMGGVFAALLGIFFIPPAIFGSFYWWRDVFREVKKRRSGG
jgi:hypothetical protein